MGAHREDVDATLDAIDLTKERTAGTALCASVLLIGLRARLSDDMATPGECSGTQGLKRTPGTPWALSILKYDHRKSTSEPSQCDPGQDGLSRCSLAALGFHSLTVITM
jgi:hypothetical protein